MHDVFLSYAHDDEAQARQLKELLERKGHSVSWDGDLVPGPDYPQQIEQAVREARRVVVLWTPDSVRSHWVLEEATMGRNQGKLIPVKLREVELPLGFTLSQTVDLQGWRGDVNHPGIPRLEKGLGLLKGFAPPPPRRWIVWLGLLAPTLIAAVIVLVLARWPWATVVEADIVTTRFRFHTAAAEPQPLFHEMAVRSLAVRGFREVRLPGVTEHNISLAGGAGLILRPSGADPARISIRPVDSREVLSIDGVSASSAEVTMDVPEPGSIGVTVRGPQVTAGASLPAEVQIIATGCASSAAAWPVDQPSVTLRSRVSPSDRLLAFSSGEGPLRLVLGLVPGREQPAPKADLSAARVEFQDQGPTGAVESTIVSGTLRFPDFGRSENLNAHDFLVLEALRSFLIRRVDLSKEGSLQMGLYGVVETISYGPKDHLKRERFTLLSVRVSAVIIAVWLSSTLLVWRRFRYAIGL